MTTEQTQDMLALYRNKTRFRHYVCKNPDMEYCQYKDWNAQFCFDNWPPFCTFLKLSGNCKHAAVKEFAKECRISCDGDLPEEKKCKPYMIKGKHGQTAVYNQILILLIILCTLPMLTASLLRYMLVKKKSTYLNSDDAT